MRISHILKSYILRREPRLIISLCLTSCFHTNTDSLTQKIHSPRSDQKYSNQKKERKRFSSIKEKTIPNETFQTAHHKSNKILKKTLISPRKLDTYLNHEKKNFPPESPSTQPISKIILITSKANPLSVVSNAYKTGFELALAQPTRKDTLPPVVLNLPFYPANTKTIEKAIASFKPHLILGGFDQTSSLFLSKIAKSYRIPSFVLASDLPSKCVHSYIHFAGHNFFSQSHILASQIQIKDLKRIAIFRPTTRKSDRLIAHLMKRQIDYNFKVSEIFPYGPEELSSMISATKALAAINLSNTNLDSHDKYSAREHVSGKDLISDSGNLTKQDVIQAVLIPDEYSVARYFIKIFKFHGLSDIKILGNHEWRSRHLLTPWDSMLKGSFFVDHIYRYDELPFAIRPTLQLTPFFIPDQDVIITDYKLLGYRMGEWIQNHSIQATHESSNYQDEKDPRLPGKYLPWPAYSFQALDTPHG